MKNQSRQKETFPVDNFSIGIDEAGRGPLAGPVVAAACFFKVPKETLLRHPMSGLIRDSKTLSEKQREEIYDFILENFHIGVGMCDQLTIDRINILEATFLAMKKAIASLSRNTQGEIRNSKFVILVDGNREIPNVSMKQRAIINGDKRVKVISVASIVAKVTRDRMMREFHKKYPQYGFDRHKGYGTAAHMEALKRFGACEIHRKSFAPVKKAKRN